jgi:hypothetical protein
MEKDPSVDQILAAIQKQQEESMELLELLADHARLQAYTEHQYDLLVELAHEGIGFLLELNAGDVISETYLAKRDELVGRAQRLLLDAKAAE